MTNLQLYENEVPLYEGNVVGQREEFSNAKMTLTNERLIFEYKRRKKLFQKEVVIRDYPITDIKIYKEVPQLAIKGDLVEVFLKTQQMRLRFENRKEAKKFHDAVMTLVTGMSKIERGAEKVKGGIGLVNDTLGIDTVSTSAEILSGGVVGGVKALFGKGKIGGKITSAVAQIGGSVGKSVANNRIKEPQIRKNTLDDSIEQVKKYKDLLDSGIITEEEFNAKKKELLGM